MKMPNLHRARRVIACAAFTLWAGLHAPIAQAFEWKLPAGAQPPAVRSDNPMSEAKVALGRALFFDPRLSVDGTMSCASCHQPAHAYADPQPRSIGVTGQKGPRNAPSLLNVGYRPVLTWQNPEVRSLEAQALIPIFGSEPVEMGMAGQAALLWQRLQADPHYPELFAKAFPEQAALGVTELYSVSTLGKALAAFQRTLISLDSRYDRFLRGESQALTARERRGERVFRSPQAGCAQCHGGQGLDEPVRAVERQLGDIRVPSLRNVAQSSPYMHDGRISSLRLAVELPHGGASPNRPRLSDADIRALLAFLGSLTYLP